MNVGVGADQSELTWRDRSGKELGIVGEPGIMANPTLSPDGTWVAIDVSDPRANNVDIWIETVKGSSSAPFTFDPPEEVVGMWSRAGSVLAYRRAHSRCGANGQAGQWHGTGTEDICYSNLR
jgi:Tol biopolymer transport system component